MRPFNMLLVSLLIVIPIMGIVHLINWLITKGVIWFMYELFQIDWYGKFWVVYVAIFIVSFILKSNLSINKNN